MEPFSSLSRRAFFLATGASLLGLGVTSPAQATTVASFEDRLKAGLKVRTKEEEAYIDLVVAKVDSKELPMTLVDRVFFWARKKAASKLDSKHKRPMVYFEPALTKLAARIGVRL